MENRSQHSSQSYEYKSLQSIYHQYQDYGRKVRVPVQHNQSRSLTMDAHPRGAYSRVQFRSLSGLPHAVHCCKPSMARPTVYVTHRCSSWVDLRVCLSDKQQLWRQLSGLHVRLIALVVFTARCVCIARTVLSQVRLSHAAITLKRLNNLIGLSSNFFIG